MRSKWFIKYKLAHRGLHNEKYPENSLGAFQNAIKHNFAIELDVRLLKDNTPVIFHDTNVKRMCGVDKELRKMTMYDLEELRLKDSKYHIPTLNEVLKLVNGQVPIMIELKPVKSNKKNILERTVYNAIANYEGDIAVKSFNPLSMLWFKKNAPEVLRGMLSSYFEHTYMPKIYKFFVKRLALYKKIQPDFISYDFRYLPNKYVQDKKVPIVAWTITSAELEKEAMKNADNVVFERYIPESPINYKRKKATK